MCGAAQGIRVSTPVPRRGTVGAAEGETRRTLEISTLKMHFNYNLQPPDKGCRALMGKIRRIHPWPAVSRGRGKRVSISSSPGTQLGHLYTVAAVTSIVRLEFMSSSSCPPVCLISSRNRGGSAWAWGSSSPMRADKLTPFPPLLLTSPRPSARAPVTRVALDS